MNVFMLVNEFINNDFLSHSCLPSLPLKEAIAQMDDTGCIFVIKENNELVGILTDGDLRRLNQKKNWSGLAVSNVMNTNPKWARETDELINTYKLMISKNLNVLPVLDSESRVVGFLSIHQLTRIFSPERIYPTFHQNHFLKLKNQDTLDENEVKHFSRYNFALQFIEKGHTVLDCACGTGYGSALLATRASSIYSIDSSDEAINFANANYQDPSIKFIKNRIESLSFENNFFDASVTIETFEHLDKTSGKKFLENIAKWTKPGGIVFISSPMLRYKDGKPYVTNPFHINEMPRDQFIKLINSIFKDFSFSFFYQNNDTFLPLLEENTGFCIALGRRNKVNIK